MYQRLAFVSILISALVVTVHCQLNGVKPVLISCYNESALPGILTANNRPPMTLNIFLEILRRLEDGNPTVTVRDMSILLVQRLRQNGITGTNRAVDLSIGIPFAPQSMESYKGTVITEHYLTNSTQTLNYGDLSMADICAFHYMISNSVNLTSRGDEAQVCIKSARYQMRSPRATRDFWEENVEARQMYVPPGDLSQCPVELGVIYTNYGTIKAGQVLQGLAAGFNNEIVDSSDNRYAATLSGDLSHVALTQMTPPLKFGASGGWNSTINPKYYFLQKNQDLEMTDQDIRGSLDGVLMALRLNSIRSKASDIKLSQIIDMYYSPYQTGVFDPTFRACNRNFLYSESVALNNLRQEIQSLIRPLDDIGQYPGTVSDAGYNTLADAAEYNFTSYLPQVNDLACPNTDSPIERIKADLLIFIDPSWTYNTIQPVISYILDNADVNKFGSRYTLYSGSDGTNITTNSTRYLLDFHQQYNLSIHENLIRKFDYNIVYQVLESFLRAKLDNNSYAGGESTVVILMPKTPPGNEKTFLEQRKEVIRRFIPDLSVLVVGSGSTSDYSSILFNTARDFISLTDTTNEDDLKNIGQNVVDNIKDSSRLIVNPSCGSNLAGSTSSFTLTEYVDFNGINYYKITPFYFSRGDGGRALKITEVSTGSITICLSREESKPSNQTSSCKTIQSNVESYDLTGWCGGNGDLNCAPIYFSVYGKTTQNKCRDALCRFPDNIKYTISLENVGCASSAITTISNYILVAVLFLFLRF